MLKSKTGKLHRARKHTLKAITKTVTKLQGGSGSRSLRPTSSASIRKPGAGLSLEEQQKLDDMILMFQSVHDNMTKNQSLFAQQMKLHDDELLHKYHHQGANALLEQFKGVDINLVMDHIKHKDTMDKKELYTLLSSKLPKLVSILEQYPHLYRLYKKKLQPLQLSPGGSLKLPDVPKDDINLQNYDTAITELNGYFDRIKASTASASRIDKGLITDINTLTAKIRVNNAEQPLSKARTLGLTKQIQKINERISTALRTVTSSQRTK